MKARLLFLFLFTFSFINTVKGQDLITFKTFDELSTYIKENNSKPLVINFWATWCAPCVKELPYFEKLNQENANVKVILVSLDFEKQVESKLKPFLKKIKYTSTSIYLADKDYNSWLPKIDKNWSGSIPATLIINQDKKVFVENDFSSFEELNTFVNQSITK
ncbi:TlpA family protein disulfide reductase [Flavobacterium sp. F372]|uniref:TlpA family protein disulfide reductase n=1 Tax=Flavobacterium bernardetii TaxID=2813823 RepID=A0ABR7IVB2_9FLAO|nr:TlpA disulfide reductase family protein [Flavobacterium bernardetii]MBC5833547.1 TlpA family protein disulfide reductase [Flavobacterium bernardetii]NHF68779.1 TlpA family protein disulfide reductase [Flavobacterium bernardetii]